MNKEPKSTLFTFLIDIICLIKINLLMLKLLSFSVDVLFFSPLNHQIQLFISHRTAQHLFFTLIAFYSEIRHYCESEMGYKQGFIVTSHTIIIIQCNFKSKPSTARFIFKVRFLIFRLYKVNIQPEVKI